MAALLPSQLAEFTDAGSSDQLQTLESVLASAFAAGLTQEDKVALLQVFERFPEQDGFGIFWSILHALEAADNYEYELVQSVRRAPNLFNTLMVNRIFNAGGIAIAGVPIDLLLREVLERSPINSALAKQVHGFLAHQAAAGNGEA